MKKGRVRTLFWLLFASFMVMILYFVFPAVRNALRGLWPFAVFSVLGGFLVWYTRKEKFKNKKLQYYLLITGWSAFAVLAGTVLHNVFYAFTVMTESVPVLTEILEYIHVLFFIISVIVAPLGYIVGTIGTIVVSRKSK